MLQEQVNTQNRELDNLGRRNQDLYNKYTRIDIECNRVSEDLIVSKGVAEQLRNECANLRAEKKIWEVSLRGSANVVHSSHPRVFHLERTRSSYRRE